MEDCITTQWIATAPVAEFETDGGKAVLINNQQIAVYYFSATNEWYATDNQCPHHGQQALSRGLTGSEGNEPKVACPFHKKTFSLKSGKCLSGDDYEITTYPVKIEKGIVYIGIP